MNPGTLRHRLTIKQLTTVSDGYGSSQEYLPIKTIWGAFNPLLGRDFFAAQQIQDGATVKFNVRYEAGKDITRAMRISYNNVDYEIMGTPQDVNGLHKEIVIYAKVVAS